MGIDDALNNYMAQPNMDLYNAAVKISEMYEVASDSSEMNMSAPASGSAGDIIFDI